MYELVFKANEELQQLALKTFKTKKFPIPYTKDETTDKCFHLVKDDGIYLMNAYNEKDPKKNKVIYAEGFNPKDKDFDWEKTHDVSGDDFAENIYFNNLQLRALIFHGASIRVFLSENTIGHRLEGIV